MDVSASAYISAAHAIKKQLSLPVYCYAEVLKNFDTLSTLLAGMPWTLSRTVGLQLSPSMWAQSKLILSEHSGIASQTPSESSNRQAFCTRGSMTRQYLHQSMVPPGLRRSVFLFPKAQLICNHIRYLDPAHIVMILCLPGLNQSDAFPCDAAGGQGVPGQAPTHGQKKSQDFDNVASSLLEYALAVR